MDDAENEETLTSAATGEVASGGPTEPPGRPLKLKGAANADGTVTLRWEAPDDDTVTGYQILRKRISRGEQTLLVHVNDTGSTATEYTDSDVTPDVLHAYRVKAINAAGLSKRSNVVKVTPVDPEQPSGNSAATGRPSIGGTPQVGETLTADTSGIGDDDGLTKVSYSYQWVVTDGGAVYRHLRRDGSDLHPGVCRPRTVHPGAGEFHGRCGEWGDADQCGD